MNVFKEKLLNLHQQYMASRRFQRLDPRQAIIDAFTASELPDSVIFFTTHKCASTYVSKVIQVLCEQSSYDAVNYASEIWRMGDSIDIESPYEMFLTRSYDRLFFRKGVIYAPQRRYLDFPGRTYFKHIFFLRDPRDVLVSAYYSFGYSHGRPENAKHKKKAQARRAAIKNKSIDEFAIEEARNWVVPLYESYAELRETSASHLFLSYDFYIEDPSSFITEICDYLAIDIDMSEKKKLIDLASPIQENLQPERHQRSGRSRQFLSELKGETIDELNEILENVLLHWRFSIW